MEEKENCCFGLKALKKEYEKLKLKYSLPSFKEINEDFDIEKLQEKESELLIREVRRAMIEKNLIYLRFVEMFMSPSTAPMFFLVLVRGLNSEEKKLLEELYTKLGRREIKSIYLDNEYNERKEAEFIKKFYKEWQEIKSKFGSVLRAVEEGWERKSERKEKGYLG